MNRPRLTALTLMSLILSLTLSGQDKIQPASPVLDIVTVDPATGFATLSWIPSVSPDVWCYMIYTDLGATAPVIDTVWSPYITNYTHYASAARYQSVAYVVAAMDSSGNPSPLSNSLSTIFLSALNDTCNNRILLSWTPYVNTSHPAGSYRLTVVKGGGPALTNVTIDSSATTYAFTDYDPATEYCFHLTAMVNAEGISSSNRVCATTSSVRAPEWVSIDAIIVEGGGLTLSGSYDQVTDINDFDLLKYNPVTSSWSVTSSAKGSGGVISFSLPAADTAMVNLYAFAAVNSCDVPATTSSPARNIVLTYGHTGTRIDLKWNNPLPSGEVLFSVWRDKGEGWDEVDKNLSDTTWSEDYSFFVSNVNAPSLAYLVTAGIKDLPAGDPLHRSSVATIQVSEKIYVPNAFTPNAPGPNEKFRPILSFVPLGYEFMTFNRSGVMLFRTTDYGEGWDGRHKGLSLPSGVYLWSLRLTTPTGVREVRTGTVTILP